MLSHYCTVIELSCHAEKGDLGNLSWLFVFVKNQHIPWFPAVSLFLLVQSSLLSVFRKGFRRWLLEYFLAAFMDRLLLAWYSLSLFMELWLPPQWSNEQNSGELKIRQGGASPFLACDSVLLLCIFLVFYYKSLELSVISNSLNGALTNERIPKGCIWTSQQSLSYHKPKLQTDSTLCGLRNIDSDLNSLQPIQSLFLHNDIQ